MASLPECRTQSQRAFQATGVDFAGPVSLKTSKLRRAPSIKAWIALFVCMTTKAVHVELVSELTSDAFLACLKRFVSRRGRPNQMHSDNGTNFVAANKELQCNAKLWTSDPVSHWLLAENITWHFNPPGAPHFGGLWEAGVKSVKTHLHRVLGATPLTFEELSTVLCQVEACLNSRPLYPLSDDPNDHQVLTPGHFLMVTAPQLPAEPDLTNMSSSTLSRWRRCQQLVQHIWAQWHKDYLHTLHQRYKWTSATPNLTPGTLVLLQEENLPATKWAIGRIVANHPGPDGYVRVVDIRTPKGTITRPIVKVCPLPIASTSPDDSTTSTGAA